MLAKQWIVQRGMTGMGPPDYPQPPGTAPPPPLPPVRPEPPAGPISEVSSAVGGVVAQPLPQSMISCDMENSNSQGMCLCEHIVACCSHQCCDDWCLL